jgi:F-type H+-transporting ATPase subunit a
MTATRPQSMEGTGGSPTASAGRNSRATTSESSSQRLSGTSLTTIPSCWGLGLVPAFRSATSNAGTTIGLGLFVFGFIQYIGIKHNGPVGYFKHFLGPVAALAPLLLIIEIVGEVAKPFSLGMRLYGNIYGEDIINGLLVKLGTGLFHLPLQTPVYLMQLFTSVIQAFIFAMLTCAYINMFTSHGHDEEGHSVEHVELPA